MTKQDVATNVVSAFRASPWLIIIVGAFLLGGLVAQRDGRLEAAEVKLEALGHDHQRLAGNVSRMQSTLDTIASRQQIVICTLNSRALPACPLLRLPTVR